MHQLRSRLQQVVAASPQAERLRALLALAWLLGPKGTGPNFLLGSCPEDAQVGYLIGLSWARWLQALLQTAWQSQCMVLKLSAHPLYNQQVRSCSVVTERSRARPWLCQQHTRLIRAALELDRTLAAHLLLCSCSCMSAVNDSPACLASCIAASEQGLL